MSYNLGDKLTKTLTGLGDFQFTCVEVNDTNAYFICDEIVSKQVFNSDRSKGNDYTTSDLKTYVDSLGVEGLTIPNEGQIFAWYPYQMGNDKRIALYNGEAFSYWTSSPFFEAGYARGAYDNGVLGGLIVDSEYGVRPCFTVENTPAPSTKPKIKLGTLVKTWKAAYTPSTPSYQVGDKLTKSLTGLGEFQFTCVEVDDTDAYFICDEIVSKQVFNSDRSKGNNYAASELKAYVDGLGVEGLTIPTKAQLEKWYSSKSDRIAQYNGTVAEYWTSSAYPNGTLSAYNVYSDGNVSGRYVYYALGVRPCFAISK